jgi:hypothetical protein
LSSATVTPAAGPAPRHRYTNIDFTGSKYAGQGLSAIFEAHQSDPRLSDWGGLPADYYDNPGAFGYSPPTSMTTDPNQRVHLFHPNSVGLPANPANNSPWASWQEIRTTDTYWTAAAPKLAKATLNFSRVGTFGPGGWPGFGTVRWYAFDILFPLNVNGVSFEAPATDFVCLGNLHSNGGSAVPFETRVIPTGGSNPKYLTFSTTPDQTGDTGVPYLNVRLLRLWDSGGKRVASAFNTWHEVVVGMKLTADNSGWFEVWFDGVQKAPQTFRQLLDPSETGPYFDLQNYTRYPTSYVGGVTRSAVVYGGLRAGTTRADVQTRIARR